MATHPDAIGYIQDLGHTEDIPWLEMICDLSAVGETTLGSDNLAILVKLVAKRASYLRQSVAPISGASVPRGATTVIERLESIGPFNGFKRLGNALVASFPKRVTIVFGANGSGKSSLCEAIQILASSDTPKRPLHDVLSATTVAPSFSFRFTSTNQTWTSRAGYGLFPRILKYFDTGTAIYNIKNSVQPGRIIELSPFKLHIFETAKDHCETFRTELQRLQNENQTALDSLVDEVRTKFRSFDGTILAKLDMPTVAILEAEIKLGESYSTGNKLDEKLQQKAELEKATSEEGLKLLKGEATALKGLHGEVQPILSAAEKLIQINPAAQATILETKENELEVLARALIPSGATLGKLMALIRPANEICNLHASDVTECPLCKQKLGENELELFKQYAGLLTGELDKAIVELRKLLTDAKNSSQIILHASPNDWAKGSVLASETIEAVKDAAKAIQAHFKLDREIDQKCKDVTSSMRILSDDLAKHLDEKEKLIEEASKNRKELLQRLTEVSSECQTLLYAKEIAENDDLVKEVLRRTRIAAFWHNNMPNFTTVLRKITATAKKANKELVVEDFKTRLNAEYLALAEKEMESFGVELKDIGGDAVVTVDHQVAGHKIDTVLSEGEQRIHALALFFAELETCEQQVIVFDDPISSFDYNYIGNYCNRLRNLIQTHSNRQIIVLTHNWEFFVQIQTTLNSAQLNQDMAVLVLESCVAIDEYSEKVDDLKFDIDRILAVTGEPTKPQKEAIAGKMRRLIEAIVNTYVFNKQRHQFKQKNQQVSAFDDFTRLVPLLPTEAQTLRDLFAKLSISEHDDPRNAYVNTDKAMFQTRYNAIKVIETAIIGRK